MEEYKRMAIEALELLKSDDAERARLAFKRLSNKELNEKYGQSGMTRKQILNNCIQRDKKIDKACKWLKSLKGI